MTVSAELRREVIARAGDCCEYCLLSQDDIFFAFEIDPIIGEKHGGEAVGENLCLACPDCNRYKGTDIASLDPATKTLTPLFNPRTQRWADHFRLGDNVIEPLTAVGRVTVLLLRFNVPERIQDREIYAATGSYPCGGATSTPPV